MTVNVPLLTKVLDHVVAHPEEWNQETWGVVTACGTAHCVAGHAVVMSGYDLAWFNGEARRLAPSSAGDGTSGVEFKAMELLGLEYGQADALFESENDLRTIFGLANHFTDGEIPIPDELPDGS